MKKETKQKLKKRIKILTAVAMLGATIYGSQQLPGSINYKKISLFNNNNNKEKVQYEYPCYFYNRTQEQWITTTKNCVCNSDDLRCRQKIINIKKCEDLGGHIDEYSSRQYCHLGETDSENIYEPRCEIDDYKECSNLFSIIEYIKRKVSTKAPKKHKHKDLEKKIKKNSDEDIINHIKLNKKIDEHGHQGAIFVKHESPPE